MSKQSLLLVDGDTRSLRVLEVSLRKAGFHVTPAASVDEATEALKQQLPDLIISETAFAAPADGFAFRDQLRADAQWAEIPFVFLTAETALENKIRGLELGVDDYLTKPIYIKEVVARINILLHKRQRAEFAKHSDGVHFSGRLADLPVVDVIQTLEVSRKSGVIQFVAEPRRASIYFRDGKVIDAEAGSLQGEDAVYRLLTWNDGEFEVVFRTVRRREVIAASSQALLMEGMRRLDEWSRLLEDLPPLTHRFALDTVTLAERLGDIPDDNNPILRLFDGKRSLLEIVEASNVGDLECLQAIARLYFEGLLLDPDRVDEARQPLPRVPESSGPVVTNIASTYLATDVSSSPSWRGSDGHVRAPAASPEPGGTAVAMKLIEEAVAAVQADDIPTLEVRRALVPAAPLARVRLATREMDPRIANARSTIERQRSRKASSDAEAVVRDEVQPEIVPVLDRLVASTEAGAASGADSIVESLAVPSSSASLDSSLPLDSASNATELPRTPSASLDSSLPLDSASNATESPRSIGEPNGKAAAREAPEAAPDAADSDDADVRYLVEEGEPSDAGETPRLRMIGSYGRERATAAGEVIPAEPSVAQPPARELITIMPRRITRSPIPLPVAPKKEAAATPTAAANTRRAAAPKLPEPLVAESVRRPAGSQSIVVALAMLAVCLVGIALTMHWRNGSRDRAHVTADAAAPDPVQTVAPVSIPVAPSTIHVDAGEGAIAPVPVSNPGTATRLPEPPALGVAPAADAQQFAVLPGAGKPPAVRDAGVPPAPQDAAVDTVAEARRLFERARAALEEGDANKALAFAAASLKLRKTARTYLEYARALQRLGQTEAALGAVDSAIQIVPTYAPSWSQRGMILWATRRRAEARLAFEKYLELDPNGRDATSVRQLLSQP